MAAANDPTRDDDEMDEKALGGVAGQLGALRESATS